MRINSHSRNRGSKFNTRKPTTIKEEHSNKQCKSTESEFVFSVSFHSAKRRYDILNLTVSLIMDKRKDFSLCIYEFSPIIFKLVQARPPVSGLESGFVFSLRSVIHYVLSVLHVNLWCRKKTKTDLMGLFNSRYIYNKQITA